MDTNTYLTVSVLIVNIVQLIVEGIKHIVRFRSNCCKCAVLECEGTDDSMTVTRESVIEIQAPMPSTENPR
jgi:hypothetical protein